jgi:hypothetical protein
VQRPRVATGAASVRRPPGAVMKLTLFVRRALTPLPARLWLQGEDPSGGIQWRPRRKGSPDGSHLEEKEWR